MLLKADVHRYCDGSLDAPEADVAKISARISDALNVTVERV